MVTEIKSGDVLVALLVDNRTLEPGTHPVTPSPWPLQMLMMKRSKGHVFAKHTHAVFPRQTEKLQEVIVVTSGKLSVTVCTREGVDVGTYEVVTGQCLFVVEGGFKIEVLEEATFYELKNGPHLEDKVSL